MISVNRRRNYRKNGRVHSGIFLPYEEKSHPMRKRIQPIKLRHGRNSKSKNLEQSKLCLLVRSWKKLDKIFLHFSLLTVELFDFFLHLWNQPFRFFEKRPSPSQYKNFKINRKNSKEFYSQVSRVIFASEPEQGVTVQFEKWLFAKAKSPNCLVPVPRDVKPRDMKLLDVKPHDVRPSDMKPRDIKSPYMKPRDIEPPDMKPRGVKPLDVKPPYMKPRGVKPRDVVLELNSSIFPQQNFFVISWVLGTFFYFSER
jgi:hypothetical protein